MFVRMLLEVHLPLIFLTMATIRLLSSNDAEGIGIVIGVLTQTKKTCSGMQNVLRHKCT